MLNQQLKSFQGFSVAEKLRLLLSIPLKKLVSRRTEALINARGVLYRLAERGGEQKSNGRFIEVQLPNYLGQRDLRLALRKHTTDFSIFEEIILRKGGDYCLVPQVAAQENIAIRTVVDAGANIGCASIFFRSLFPDARILSIEADADNFAVLKKNVELNGDANIQSLHRAFWKNNDLLSFGVGLRGTKEEQLSFGVIEEGERKVQGFTFADCLATLQTDRIDLLKMDIEGAEKALLDDRPGFLNLLNHTRLLAIELHYEAVDPLEFIEVITAAGFRYVQYGEITLCWRKEA